MEPQSRRDKGQGSNISFRSESPGACFLQLMPLSWQHQPLETNLSNPSHHPSIPSSGRASLKHRELLGMFFLLVFLLKDKLSELLITNVVLCFVLSCGSTLKARKSFPSVPGLHQALHSGRSHLIPILPQVCCDTYMAAQL